MGMRDSALRITPSELWVNITDLCSHLLVTLGYEPLTYMCVLPQREITEVFAQHIDSTAEKDYLSPHRFTALS